MKTILATSILTATLITGGCATKKYVRNTSAPIQTRVEQVGQTTVQQGQSIEENKKQISDVDQRAEQGISAAKERAMTAENKANEANTAAGNAMNRANQAADTAGKAVQDVGNLKTELTNVVANLDDYKLQGEGTVPFKFNQWKLTDDAKQELDRVVADKGRFHRYFIAVEGYTDKSGSADYNATLSRKRADSVVQYLVTKHQIPIYRVHMIGLGKEKPADESNTRAARAKNRRVEVKIFSADQTMASNQMSSPASSAERAVTPATSTDNQNVTGSTTNQNATPGAQQPKQP